MKRKAQGAIEYRFMIAAALVIIFIVVKQLQGRGSSAKSTANKAETSVNNTLNSMLSSG